jgi:hypothetical protein
MTASNRYVSTVTVYSPLCFDGLRVGQWFQWAGADGNGSRGQWLGKTKAGADAVRYQSGKFGKVADTKRNHLMRKWALSNGAK